MSNYAGLGELVEQIRETSRSIELGDARTDKRIDDLEASVNELFKKTQRPGLQTADDNEIDERKDAIGLCRTRRCLTVPRLDGGMTADYVPTSSEIDEALVARKALRSFFRYGDTSRLDPLEKKSLSNFSFGGNGFLVAPEMSNTVLSCLADPTDLSGLMNRVQIGAPSIKFLIDNVRMQIAGWACEASCFANNPQPDLNEGLGELEIKAETLRYTVCATSDLLADSAFDVEGWLMQKAGDGFRTAINAAILVGDGVGKPLGLLSPNSGVPMCETSPATQPGQFTWQDLVMLKYEIPLQWQPGASFLMNQRTFALLLTMSDASGKPIWSQLPGQVPGFTLAGSPIVIATQMPDVAPGATPVAFGNWRSAYTIADRSAVTVQRDPYSAGWCILFKWEARIGGAVTCPNACRLLRVR